MQIILPRVFIIINYYHGFKILSNLDDIPDQRLSWTRLSHVILVLLQASIILPETIMAAHKEVRSTHFAGKKVKEKAVAKFESEDMSIINENLLHENYKF